jgi:predicted helicase
MQKLLNCDISLYQIDCFTAKTKKKEYINNFKNDTNISLMLNVQILNEGTNIPICDSVYIIKPSDNIINLIQRMSRANRILEDKTECKIYLWCSKKKIEKILNYINENTNYEFKNKVYKFSISEKDTIVNKYNDDNIKKYNDINKYNNINNSNKFIFSLFDQSILKDLVIYSSNNIWFNSNIICRILNYTRGNLAIRQLVDEKNIKQLKDLVVNYNIYKNSQPSTLYIDEYGLYSLILNSNKKCAEKYYEIILNKLLSL